MRPIEKRKGCGYCPTCETWGLQGTMTTEGDITCERCRTKTPAVEWAPYAIGQKMDSKKALKIAVASHLRERFGPIHVNNTVDIICQEAIDYAEEYAQNILDQEKLALLKYLGAKK